MDLFTNIFIVENTSRLGGFFVGAFIISFLLSPLVGRIARLIGALDLPVSMRNKNDRANASRMNPDIKLRLGGLAVSASILIMLLLTQKVETVGFGIIIAFLVIVALGILDDTRELSGTVQIIMQITAAFIVVLSGISVTQISILGQSVSFNWINGVLELGSFVYNFVFPADLFTILWLVGVINVINWVGGVDGLNISVCSIIAFTMMILSLGNGNIELAFIIAIFIGANVGLLPFNYNPSLIIPGSIGDYVNGFMLGLFAIMSGTSWNASIVVLGLPIIDAMLVVILRIKSHPEVVKNPLKILSINDKNHLHHRLLDVGYSRKMVLLIEVSIMLALSVLAIFFTSIRRDVVAAFTAVVSIIIIFTVINYFRQRAMKQKQRKISTQKIPEIKVILDENDKDDYEKFAY